MCLVSVPLQGLQILIGGFGFGPTTRAQNPNWWIWFRSHHKGSGGVSHFGSRKGAVQVGRVHSKIL